MQNPHHFVNMCIQASAIGVNPEKCHVLQSYLQQGMIHIRHPVTKLTALDPKELPWPLSSIRGVIAGSSE